MVDLGISFLAGCFVGVIVGIVVACLLVAAKDN